MFHVSNKHNINMRLRISYNNYKSMNVYNLLPAVC